MTDDDDVPPIAIVLMPKMWPNAVGADAAYETVALNVCPLWVTLTDGAWPTRAYAAPALAWNALPALDVASAIAWDVDWLAMMSACAVSIAASAAASAALLSCVWYDSFTP